MSHKRRAREGKKRARKKKKLTLDQSPLRPNLEMSNPFESHRFFFCEVRCENARDKSFEATFSLFQVRLSLPKQTFKKKIRPNKLKTIAIQKSGS